MDPSVVTLDHDSNQQSKTPTGVGLARRDDDAPEAMVSKNLESN